MIVTDLLAPADVLVDLRAGTKARVLAELARYASRALAVAPDAILDGLLRREELGSTGMGDGVAIPHLRLAEVKAPFGILARLRSAIPFAAIDDRPVDIVFLLLLPVGTTGAGLNALACVSRQLRDAALVEALREAATPSDLHCLFRPVGGPAVATSVAGPSRQL